MLKYSSIILLVAVAIFWSQVDAKPKSVPYKRSADLGPHKRSPDLGPHKRSADLGPHKRSADLGPHKRSADPKNNLLKREIGDEISEETQEELVKELLVGLLLLTADTSAEERVLTEKFKEALEKKWDSIDDFGNHIAEVYEEVTGKRPDESDESEESPENAIED